MRFALLGDHPDGLAFAAALADSGRHQLLVYSGRPAAADGLRRRCPGLKLVGDLEEVLADPAVEAVIVAGKPADRPAQLRRALQSERHVLCVHPADASADLAYEAAMIRQDTGHVLLPLLPEALHPGVVRLAELLRSKVSPLGEIRLLHLERTAPEKVLIDTDDAGHKPAVPGWDVLRALAGEVAEVCGFAAAEEAASNEPLLLTGRFENGPLFQVTLLPGQAETCWRVAVVGSRSAALLTCPREGSGIARLTWRDKSGEEHAETWDDWQPWPPLIEAFEAAVGGTVPRVTWQDAIRCLELDGAVRRSVHYRRSSAMEYQEANEEVGFKGTMTLVGCALLWGLLFLLVVAMWEPRLFWLSVPLLAGFLLLQMLRWIIPAPSQDATVSDASQKRPPATAPAPTPRSDVPRHPPQVS